MSEYFIIAFISRSWKMFQRVPHYAAMSKYVKVLCVELPLTILDCVFRPGKVWKQRYKINNRYRRINDNLFVYTPIAVAPFGLSYRSNLLSRLNKYMIARGVKKLLKRLQVEKYISIIHASHLSCLVDILKPLARVYEVADEKATSEKCPNLNKLDAASKLLQRKERNILSAVNIVFATSTELYERKRQYNKNTYFIPNGVDLNHFWGIKNKKLSDITVIPRPRIGYVGHINTFLDFEWLDYSAASHPKWYFVFIGNFDNRKILNRDPSFLQFIKRKNVFMLGRKNYEDLPDYMQEMDVFLLPRKDCDYSQNSNPNKIYQYLSTGKPIVSSKFSSVEPFKGPVYIADDKLTFSRQIEMAVCENDSMLKKQRQELARQNDLSLRAKDKINIINAYLSK